MSVDAAGLAFKVSRGALGTPESGLAVLSACQAAHWGIRQSSLTLNKLEQVFLLVSMFMSFARPFPHGIFLNISLSSHM